MTGFRVPLWGVVLMVVLIAADLALLQGPSFENVSLWKFVLVSLLPALNVLIIGLALMIRSLVRSGECQPFGVGFQVTAWPTLTVFAMICLEAVQGDSEWIKSYFGYVLETTQISDALEVSGIIAWLNEHPDSALNLLISTGFFVLIFGLPLLSIPILGGLVFLGFDLRLVRNRRSSPSEPSTAFDLS